MIVRIWYVIVNGGDGSVHLKWFLTEQDATKYEDNMDEGWGEPSRDCVQTYVGSDIYEEAKKNSEE